MQRCVFFLLFMFLFVWTKVEEIVSHPFTCNFWTKQALSPSVSFFILLKYTTLSFPLSHCTPREIICLPVTLFFSPLGQWFPWCSGSAYSVPLIVQTISWPVSFAFVNPRNFQSADDEDQEAVSEDINHLLFSAIVPGNWGEDFMGSQVV